MIDFRLYHQRQKLITSYEVPAGGDTLKMTPMSVSKYSAVISEIFSQLLQEVIFVGVLQPAGRPTGLDAGPLLQAFVVGRQPWVALLAQPEQVKARGFSAFDTFMQPT